MIEELERLEYFKYADSDDLEHLKLEVAKGLAEDKIIPFVEGDGPTYKEMDPRHYALDGEDLYEQGGIVDALQKMTPFFEKLNIKLAITDQLEEYDTENHWLNYEITINGKKYVVFRNFEGYGWGEAAQRFADMINDQLKLQGVDERLYLMNGGNEGRAIFLNDELSVFITRLVKDIRERPLKTDEWCRVMLVQYAEIT